MALSVFIATYVRFVLARNYDKKMSQTSRNYVADECLFLMVNRETKFRISGNCCGVVFVDEQHARCCANLRQIIEACNRE